jgi:hypothetical protein
MQNKNKRKDTDELARLLTEPNFFASVRVGAVREVITVGMRAAGVHEWRTLCSDPIIQGDG